MSRRNSQYLTPWEHFLNEKLCNSSKSTQINCLYDIDFCLSGLPRFIHLNSIERIFQPNTPCEAVLKFQYWKINMLKAWRHDTVYSVYLELHFYEPCYIWQKMLPDILCTWETMPSWNSNLSWNISRYQQSKDFTVDFLFHVQHCFIFYLVAQFNGIFHHPQVSITYGDIPFLHNMHKYVHQFVTDFQIC